MIEGVYMVGRFQVMATLQAARAYVLGMPIATAKSFGIQRAIFYAAAKRGFSGRGRRGKPDDLVFKNKKVSLKEIDKIQKSFAVTTVGDEPVYSVEINGKKYFVIGNEIKTNADFKKQVERRFGSAFKDAWKEAVTICKHYDRGVLLSQRYFYSTVYKTRRDELAEKWTKRADPEK
jgi:hypothetical protein